MRRRGRRPHPDILTPREWEVLELLRQDLNNVEIAERLEISRDGVKYHVSQILSKLNLESREQAAAWQPNDRRTWFLVPIAAKIAAASLVLAALVGIGFLGAAVILSEDDDAEFRVSPPEGGFPFATFAPAVDFVPAGDVHPIGYVRAIPVNDADYVPPEPAAEPSELLASRGFQPFDGDEANGIKSFFSLSEFREFRDVCGDQDFWKFEEYDGISYEWEPGGAYRFEPQQVAVCPDGSVPTILDTTEGSWGSLQIQYFVGDRGLWHQAGDKYKGEIAGRPTVVVTYSGNEPKRTWIGMAVEYGLISVEARGLAAEEALRVAEGITCDYCGPP